MDRKTILIADDDQSLVQALTLRCRKLGLNVQQAFDSLSALNAIQAGAPDLVCLDVNMPNGDGFKVCEMLSDLRARVPIPIIILTGRTDAATVKTCHELCAYYVLKCEDVWPRIEPLLDEILGNEHSKRTAGAPDSSFAAPARPSDASDDPRPAAWTEPIVAVAPAATSALRPRAAMGLPTRKLTGCSTLLVVDDDLDMVRTIKSFVARTELKVVHCEGFEDTERLARQAVAVLCDIHLREMRGTFVVHELRSRGFQKPVIIISGDSRKETVCEVANTGIDAFLVKPFRKQQLLETLRRHTGLALDERPSTRVL